MLSLIMYGIVSLKCETYNLAPFVMPTFAEQCNRLDASAIHPNNSLLLWLASINEWIIEISGKCYEAKVAKSDRLQSIDDLNYLCSSMLDGRLAFPFEDALATFLGQIVSFSPKFSQPKIQIQKTVNKHYMGAVNPLTQNPRTTVSAMRKFTINLGDSKTHRMAANGRRQFDDNSCWWPTWYSWRMV